MKKLLVIALLLSSNVLADDIFERQINVSVNVFKEGEMICKSFNGLKAVSINSKTGEYSFICIGYDKRISISVEKGKS